MAQHYASGHRERLKQKFNNKNSLDEFEDHEILELLLFYSIPQKNTNEIAHELIKKFNSFHRVFDAPLEELVKINGISVHTATFIKLLPHLCSKYYSSKSLYSGDEIGKIKTSIYNRLISEYISQTNEIMYVICLDSSYNILRFEKISEGTNNSVNIFTKKIVETAILTRASIVIISHNHPSGIPSPSRADCIATKYLHSALSLLSIDLVDHIIVSGTDFFSMASANIINKFKNSNNESNLVLCENTIEYDTSILDNFQYNEDDKGFVSIIE